MTDNEHRRKSKRFQARWKVAVLFDKATGKPVLHTETQDLSLGGTAIRSDYDDLTGTFLTLLIAHPPRHKDEVPKLLKIRARVVSSVQTPGKSGFRHGLSFVQANDDSLEILAGLLSARLLSSTVDDAAAPTQQEAVPEPNPPPATPPAPAANRLAQLKQLAMAKQTEESKPDPQRELDEQISAALERAYRYLKEFAAQISIAKPAYAKDYSIVGAPNFDGLAWEEARADIRPRHDPSGKTKIYEQVTLYFRLSAKKQLRVTRESPADEKLQRALLDNKIEFSTQESRNERGFTERTTFVFPCEVTARLHLMGNFTTGKLLLRAHNVERFGMLEYVLAPEAINEASLDELSGFILGETARIGPLLLANA